MSIFLKEEVQKVNVPSEVQEEVNAIAESFSMEDDEVEVRVNADEPKEYFTNEELEFTEEATALFEEVLNEKTLATSRKVVVKTKAQKMGALEQKAVMSLAQAGKDPLYKQYEKYRKLELAIRKKLEKKYKSQAKAATRAAIQAK